MSNKNKKKCDKKIKKLPMKADSTRKLNRNGIVSSKRVRAVNKVKLENSKYNKIKISLQIIKNDKMSVLNRDINQMFEQIIYLISQSQAKKTEFKDKWLNWLNVIEPSLSVVFVSSEEMVKLNSKYRNKAYSTDILSFNSNQTLGELVICSEVIKEQARRHGLSQKHELGYMLIHGVLHLLGYDHEKSLTEQKKMFAIQDKVFEDLISFLS